MTEPMTEPIILVVEDELSMRNFVSDALANRGHAVTAVATGEQAIDILGRMPQPDLVILDLGLPGIDGLAVLEHLRRDSITPVLVLSARGSQSDKVRALDAGADDYLAKPFGLPELIARVGAQLRRAALPPTRTQSAIVGDVEIDLTHRKVVKASREVRLTPTEFALLRELVLNAGRVITHRELLQKVWGPEYAGESQYTRTFVQRLRVKLEDDPSSPELILTETGLGYRLRELDSRILVDPRRRTAG
jgi:two-component system, OmpR family, KDP operon response regulator KdpE